MGAPVDLYMDWGSAGNLHKRNVGFFRELN